MPRVAKCPAVALLAVAICLSSCVSGSQQGASGKARCVYLMEKQRILGRVEGFLHQASESALLDAEGRTCGRRWEMTYGDATVAVEDRPTKQLLMKSGNFAMAEYPGLYVVVLVPGAPQEQEDKQFISQVGSLAHAMMPGWPQAGPMLLDIVRDMPPLPAGCGRVIEHGNIYIRMIHGEDGTCIFHLILRDPEYWGLADPALEEKVQVRDASLPSPPE
jgi:hypothetical protein